jgi:hypothetical protein
MRHEHVFEQVDEDLTARWVLAPCLRGLVLQRAEHVRQVVEPTRR